jgi:CDP-glucose 4,6-dehydratase
MVCAGFWSGRRVLVTGHTGFKGAWLCLMLHALGAHVSGLSLPSIHSQAHDLLGVSTRLRRSYSADIREPGKVEEIVRKAGPEVVFHLAAQALVGEGYRDPGGTFATNVTGTAHLLQALRGQRDVVAAVIVTSDKVYRNDNMGQPFREDDPLGGVDPYSASKAAAELAVTAWRHSFKGEMPPMATARAGNVIGGGDFALERLVPDLVRAERSGSPLVLRSPDATRPFQHVLDVLRGYLLLAQALAADSPVPQALNFGPQDAELRVRDLIGHWEAATGRAVRWETAGAPVIVEQRRLALDSSLAHRVLGWSPCYDTPGAIARTAQWYAAWAGGVDLRAYSEDEVGKALSPSATQGQA